MDTKFQLINTLLMSFTAFMSLVVTFLAYKATVKANSISSKALEIQKSENKPIIRVYGEIVDLGSGLKSESISISNDGSPIRINHSNYSLASFLEISAYGSYNVDLPIYSKFGSDTFYRNQRGKLITISAVNTATYTKSMNLIHELKNININIQCFPVTYIKIPYKNIYDENKFILYKYSWHSVEEIEEDKFNDMYQYYTDYQKDNSHINFMDLTAQEILETTKLKEKLEEMKTILGN